MSQKHVTVLEILRLFFYAGVLAVTSSALAAGQEGAKDTCSGALPVELNSRLHSYGDKQGEPFLVKLELPSPGILSVDVAVSGAAPVEPKLAFAGLGCGTSETDSEPTVLERSATHLVLVAPAAGTHLFRVASQDPRLPLREFEVRTGFAPDSPHSPSPTKGGEDEGEIELQPNTLISPGSGSGRSLQSRLHELCLRTQVDDHGDSFTCSTFLSPGRDVVGEIRNDWGDDEDVFQFILGGSRTTSLWTVEMETAGDVDIFGVLYDRSGQRLEKSGDDGTGTHSRIVRTLGPGTYFVRLEGRQGSEGFYTLSVDASPW